MRDGVQEQFRFEVRMLDLCFGYRFLLELIMVVAIIGLAIALSIPHYRVALLRAHLSEAFPMTATARIDLAERLAVQGEWPAADPVATSPDLARVTIKGGVVRVGFTPEAGAGLAGRHLTFRPAILKENPTGPLIFACGHHFLGPGWQVAEGEVTDVDGRALPEVCR